MASWDGRPRACWSSPQLPKQSIESSGSPWSDDDGLMVGGGEALYLAHWLRQSDWPTSAVVRERSTSDEPGSMAMTTRKGRVVFLEAAPVGDDALARLGISRFFPPLDNEDLTEKTWPPQRRGRPR